MRTLKMIGLALLVLGPGLAQARSVEHVFNMSTRYTDRSLDFTSDTTTSARDMKMLVEARDEAASFVASNGAIRGARLEAAFQALRGRFPEAREASDLALAGSILAL